MSKFGFPPPKKTDVFHNGLWSGSMIRKLNRRHLRTFFCLLGLGLIAAGCVPTRGGWDVQSLPANAKVDAPLKSSRIGDLLPQLRPDDLGLSLFLCRWSKETPILVALPSGADARELRLLRLALSAWEKAGLGVSFREVAAEEARLEIVFPRRVGGASLGSGNALADCRLDLSSADPEDFEAHLVWGSVHIYRASLSWKGHAVPLEDDELLGAILHELGHALGFSGHVASGRSIMVKDTDQVRQIARKVAEGQPLPAPELVALYGLPSGVSVGTRSLSGPSRQAFVALAEEADRRSWQGPYSRTGDRKARFFYRGQSGKTHGLTVENWSMTLRDHEPPEIVAD